MSSHPNCYSQYCNYNCCDYMGSCPMMSYQCHYYYKPKDTSTELGEGTIAGIVVGSVVGLAIIIALICYCCRKRQKEAYQEQLSMQSMHNLNNASTHFINPT